MRKLLNVKRAGADQSGDKDNRKGEYMIETFKFYMLN